ncbi:MAG: hypothetical protein JXQ99_16240 [Hyphomicrobiaceae bacterium]
MKKFFAIAILAAATALSAAPANAQMSALKSLDNAAVASDSAIVHKTGRRGRRGRFAAGLALGIVGAAIATHHYGYHRPYYSSRWSRHERRCRRWRRSCYRGYDRACWKYDNRC